MNNKIYFYIILKKISLDTYLFSNINLFTPQISLGIGNLILSIGVRVPKFFGFILRSRRGVVRGLSGRVLGVVPSDVCAGEDLQILIRFGGKGVLK